MFFLFRTTEFKNYFKVIYLSKEYTVNFQKAHLQSGNHFHNYFHLGGLILGKEDEKSY